MTLKKKHKNYKVKFQKKVIQSAINDLIYGPYTKEIIEFLDLNFNLLCENIIWFDETQANFLQINQKHRRPKGQNYANSSDSNTHFTFTCLVAGNLNEIFKPWFLYPKSRVKENEMEYLSVKNREDMVILLSESSMITRVEVYVFWEIILQEKTYDAPILIIEDQASAHNAEHGKFLLSFLKYDNFENFRDSDVLGFIYDVCTIPGGLTSYFQAFDMAGGTFSALKRVFRHYTHKYFDQGPMGGVDIGNGVVLKSKVAWSKSSKMPLATGMDIFMKSFYEVTDNNINENRENDFRTNFQKYNYQFMRGCGLVLTCGVGLKYTNSKIFKYFLLHPQTPPVENLEELSKKLAFHYSQTTIMNLCQFCSKEFPRGHKKTKDLALHELTCNQNPRKQDPRIGIEMQKRIDIATKRMKKIIQKKEIDKNEILQIGGNLIKYKENGLLKDKVISEIQFMNMKSFYCFIGNCQFCVRDKYTRKFQLQMYHHIFQDHTENERASHQHEITRFLLCGVQRSFLNSEIPKNYPATPQIWDKKNKTEHMVRFANKSDSYNDILHSEIEVPPRPKKRKNPRLRKHIYKYGEKPIELIQQQKKEEERKQNLKKKKMKNKKTKSKKRKRSQSQGKD